MATTAWYPDIANLALSGGLTELDDGGQNDAVYAFDSDLEDRYGAFNIAENYHGRWSGISFAPTNQATIEGTVTNIKLRILFENAPGWDRDWWVTYKGVQYFMSTDLGASGNPEFVLDLGSNTANLTGNLGIDASVQQEEDQEGLPHPVLPHPVYCASEDVNIRGVFLDITYTPVGVNFSIVSPVSITAGAYADVTAAVAAKKSFAFTVTGPISNFGVSVSLLSGPAVAHWYTLDAVNHLAWIYPAYGASQGLAGTAVFRATSLANPAAYADFTVVASAAIAVTTVTSTNPLYGATIGVTGSGFTGATSVKIGTTAVSFTVQSDTAISISGTVPQGTTGVVTVVSPSGTASGTQTVTVQTVSIAASTGFTGGYLTTGTYTPVMTCVVSGAYLTGYSMTATGGTFESSNGYHWKSDTTGTFTVTAMAAADASKQVAKTYTVVAAPYASSFSASTLAPLYGASATLTPVFTGGSGVVNQGIGAVTSGSGYSTGAITAPKTFTLTVTNLAGDTYTYNTTVAPQTVSLTIAASRPAVTPGHTTATLTATVYGAANTNVTWSLVSGPATVGSTTGTTCLVTPTGTGAICVRATSVGDTSKYTDIVIPSYAVPTVALTSNVATVLKGGVATLYPHIQNYTAASINQDIGACSDGDPLSTGTLTVATTYTLTATNADGISATAQLTIRPYDVFVGTGNAAAGYTGNLATGIQLQATAQALAGSTAAFSVSVRFSSAAGAVASSTASLDTQIQLSGSNVAVASVLSSVLYTKTQFQATASADSQGWGNISTAIWLLGFSQAVATNVGGGNLTTKIQLATWATNTTEASAVIHTNITLVALGVAEPSASQPILVSFTLIAGYGKATGSGLESHLLTPAPRLTRHTPGVYFQRDPNAYAVELLKTLDQNFASTVEWVSLFPRNMVHASKSKFVQELLDQQGNPFKFQVEDVAARDLVGNLQHIYRQRGTLLGLQRAIRYLLKRELPILDFIATAWRLGISELELSTQLGGAIGTPMYGIEVPDEFTTQQVMNLKAIVTFMSPPNVQFRYIRFSRLST